MNANRHQCNNMGIKNKHVEGERKVGDKLTLQFNCVVIMTDENCDYTCTSCCYVQGGVCVVCVLCVCVCVCVFLFLWCVCVCVSVVCVCLCFCVFVFLWCVCVMTLLFHLQIHSGKFTDVG